MTLLIPFLVGWLSLGSLLDCLRLRPLLRTVDYILGWICFTVLLSFPTIDPRGPKRMLARRTPATLASKDGEMAFTLHQDKSKGGDSIEVGDVILCNHVIGLVDCLYAWWMFSPRIFGKLNRFSVAWKVIQEKREMTREMTRESENTKITFYFPEGTRTNGRGVLQFSPSQVVNPSSRVHLLCLKYQCAAVDPMAFGLLGTLWQLSILCGQVKNNLTSRMIGAHALAALQKDLNAKTMQQLIAALGHSKALGMTAQDKLTFAQFLKENRS